jgi:uncharacterized repeat protein (TIGR02543 family)
MDGSGLSVKRKDVTGTEFDAGFVCWNTKPDRSGKTYYPGDALVMNDEDGTVGDDGTRRLTLYAQYSQYRETTLVYNKNATEQGADLVAQAADTNLTKETNGTVLLRFQDDLKPAGSSTGSSGRPNTAVTVGRDRNNVEFVAKRPGYTFQGWAKKSNATTPDAKNGDKIYVNKLNENTETLFMAANTEHMFLSSSMIKQVCILGGDVSPFLPEEISKEIIEKLKG